jgi:hypothetical protein
MTVNTATSTATYTGNGSTTVFPVPFYFLVNTDLQVLQKVAATGVVKTLVLNSDFTLTGAGVEAGGTLTMTVAPATGDTLYIARNVTAVQQTAYPANSPFPAASHEMALDRLTMLAQQLQTTQALTLQKPALSNVYDLQGNTLINEAVAVNAADVPNLAQVQQITAAAAGGVLPGTIALTAQSTQIADLASTATGKGAALVGYLTGTVKSFLDSLSSAGSATGSALIGFLQGGTGAVAHTVQAKLRERVSVKDFGAIGDGGSHPLSGVYATLAAAQVVYPHATALTNEIDWCATQSLVNYFATLGGGNIYFPRGTYIFDRPITCALQSAQFAGESRRSSVLQFNDGVNGFVCTTNVDTSTSTAAHQELSWLDLEVRTLNTGASATAISVTNSSAGSVPVSQVVLERVSIVPQNGFNNGWSNGLYCSSASGVTVNDCFIIGKYNTTVGKGIYFTNYCIDNFVTNCRILYWDVGVQDDHLGQASHGSEGLYISCDVIVNCNTGVYRGQTTGLSDPFLTVVGSHINCRVNCITTYNIYNILVTGSLLYVQGTATQTMAANAACVLLQNNAPADNPTGVSITGNCINALGVTTQSPVGASINLPYCTVTGNVFNGFASAIAIVSNNGVLGGNQYIGCTNQINNVSGSTWFKLARTALSAGISSE